RSTKEISSLLRGGVKTCYTLKTHLRKVNRQESNAEHLARKRETSYLKITTGYAVFVIPPLPRFIMSCQKEAEKAGEFIQMDCLSATIVMMKYIEMAVS